MFKAERRLNGSTRFHKLTLFMSSEKDCREWIIILDFTSIEESNLQRCFYGKSILTLLPTGEAAGGATGNPYKTEQNMESSENCTSLRAEYGLMSSCMNLTTSERITCGLLEKQLRAAMKKSMQSFLTNLSEDLFANSEKQSQKSDYEQRRSLRRR